MSHKTATIECNPREAFILAGAKRFLTVIKLGRGQEFRQEADEFPLADVPQRCGACGRGASVYGIGVSPEGLEVAVLAAVFRPGPRGGWKFAEGFKPE